MNSSSNIVPEDKNAWFNLILLGTDTHIEGNGWLLGYERGELLNAIFRCLQGQEFIDKHIVSGAETLGRDTNKKVAEAILMVLKAISEGKTRLKIAAHSRGGIEAILVTHALEIMITHLKNATKETFEEFINALNFGYATKTFKAKCKLNNGKLKFTSEQTKDEGDRKSTITKEVKTDHEIDIEQLISKLKASDFSFSAELFVIDPVPGQKKLSSWVLPEFFVISKLVKKAHFIYMKDERTKFFDPVVPQEFPKDCVVKIMAVPGHHGTASGWLNEQTVIQPGIIANDEPRTTTTSLSLVAASTATNVTTNANLQRDSNSPPPVTTMPARSSPPPEQVPVRTSSPSQVTLPLQSPSQQTISPATKHKGKRTRHVSRLMVAEIVEFFDSKAFVKGTKKDETITSLEDKTLLYSQLGKDALNRKKLELYEKIAKNRDEYRKFHQTRYPWLLSTAERYVLVSATGDYLIPFSRHSKLLDPVIAYVVNDDHIMLLISALTEKFPQLNGGSPADIILQFAKMFSEPDKNTKEVENLYGNVEIAERYTGYFYRLVGEFVATRVEVIMAQQGDVSAQLDEVKNLIAAIDQLKVKLSAYENAKKSKIIITTKLDKTWKDIVDSIAIIPKIHAINDELLLLVKDKSEKPDSNSERSTAFISLANRIEKTSQGLTSMRDIGLITEETHASYARLRDSLIKIIKLAATVETKIQLLTDFDQSINTKLRELKQLDQQDKQTQATLELRMRQLEGQIQLHQAAVESLAAERNAFTEERKVLSNDQQACSRDRAQLNSDQMQLATEREALNQANLAAERKQAMLTRCHPVIQGLDEKILLFSQSSPKSEADSLQDSFVAALTNLRHALKADVDKELMNGQSRIETTTAGKLAIQTTKMLERFHAPNADKLQVIREYEAECKRIPQWEKFLKVIGVVIIAAVGVASGAYIGLSVVAGSWLAPGAFVNAALSLLAAPPAKELLGVAASAVSACIASGIGSSFMLFSRDKLSKQAITVAELGVKANLRCH